MAKVPDFCAAWASTSGSALWVESNEGGQTITVRIGEQVKRAGAVAGVRAKYKELNGFIPGSLLAGLSPESLVGTNLTVKVADADWAKFWQIFDRRRSCPAERGKMVRYSW